MVESWCRTFDLWLDVNQVGVREATVVAADCGIACAPRILARIAGKACEHWLHRRGRRVRPRQYPAVLSARGWERLDKAIRKLRAGGHIDPTDRCLAAADVARMLSHLYRMNHSIKVVGEGLAAQGIYYPARTERPAWPVPKEKTDGERE